MASLRSQSSHDDLDKGSLADGQRVSDVRKEVEKDLDVQNVGQRFELGQQLEKEAQGKTQDSPATKSAFNEIKDFAGKSQDGKGGGD